MTEREELLGNLPLQYVDGPEYCTVTDATGGAFALTVQPELMKLMEQAALNGVAQQPWQPIETAPKDGTRIDVWFQLTVDHGGRWANVSWSPEHKIWSGGPPSQYKDGWVATYWMPFPACPSVSSTSRRCGFCDGPLPCLTHSQPVPSNQHPKD